MKQTTRFVRNWLPFLVLVLAGFVLGGCSGGSGETMDPAAKKARNKEIAEQKKKEMQEERAARKAEMRGGR